MNLVSATIRPFRLDDRHAVPTPIEVQGLTVVEIVDSRRQKGKSEIYRGADVEVRFTSKVKLAIAADQPDAVLGAATRGATAGMNGHGTLCVPGLETMVRVRTGELDQTAL